MDRTDITQMTLRLPEKLHEKLKEEAKRRGLGLKSIIVMILWKHFENAAQG